MVSIEENQCLISKEREREEKNKKEKRQTWEKVVDFWVT